MRPWQRHRSLSTSPVLDNTATTRSVFRRVPVGRPRIHHVQQAAGRPPRDRGGQHGAANGTRCANLSLSIGAMAPPGVGFVIVCPHARRCCPAIQSLVVGNRSELRLEPRSSPEAGYTQWIQVQVRPGSRDQRELAKVRPYRRPFLLGVAQRQKPGLFRSSHDSHDSQCAAGEPRRSGRSSAFSSVSTCNQYLAPSQVTVDATWITGQLQPPALARLSTCSTSCSSSRTSCRSSGALP